MSRPPSGPRLQPHMHARLGARSRVRWRRAAGLRHAPTGVALVLVAATLTRAAPLVAQQPQLAPYTLPVIALVQPPNGGSVPQDKPVVVFRFTQGEPGDPLDLRSLVVTVDGQDRTALFQMILRPAAPDAQSSAIGEAWGPLVGAGSQNELANGAHQVSARICSSHGVCGEVSGPIAVLAAPNDNDAATPSKSRRQRMLDALLHALRTLLPGR